MNTKLMILFMSVIAIILVFASGRKYERDLITQNYLVSEFPEGSILTRRDEGDFLISRVFGKEVRINITKYLEYGKPIVIYPFEVLYKE